MAIFDTMNFIKPDVSTLCCGFCGQHGRLPAGGGRQGQALFAAQLQDHDPPGLGGAQGQATDIEIHARDILRTKDQMNKILAERTGQPLEKVAARHRARLLHDGRRSQGLRHRRPGDRQAGLSPRCRLRWQRGVFPRARRFYLVIIPTLRNKAPHPWPRKKALPAKNPLLLVLRQEPARGQEADRRSVGVHLRRVHRPVQRNHPRRAARR
jgi:hypothetical protein